MSSSSQQLRAAMRALIEREPVFDRSRDAYLSREQLFEAGLRRSVRMEELAASMSADERRVFEEELSLETPFFLHTKLSTRVVIDQMSDEQQRRWLPRFERLHVLTAFCSTELGHGSDVQGIETTATFDPTTDEFVLNSPTTTSIKWWPGALGNCATHAFVLAQLVLKGKRAGVFPFLVQLRDLDTHEALPGREIMNIGPKMGFHPVDNGMLRLEHVRVPRDAMPARHAHVTRDGELVRTSAHHSKATYSAMVFARAHFVHAASRYLSAAVTIAIRYSMHRTQFDVRLLDYQTHKHRLLPFLAAAHAMALGGDEVKALFNETMADQSAGGLKHLHAVTSGLKSVSMRVCVQGMESARRACGGSGYLLRSGIPDKLNTAVHMCTAEGDSHVINQQVVRYLLKTTKPGSDARGDARGCLPLLARLTTAHLAELERRLRGGADWNGDVLLLVQKTADAWSLQRLCDAFNNANKGMADVARLFELWALVHFGSHLADLLIAQIVTAEGARALQTEYEQALAGFGDERVVELVDALDVSDFVLNSSIGRKHGDPYEALVADLGQDPMNDADNATVRRAIDEVLLPFMKRRRRTSKL